MGGALAELRRVNFGQLSVALFWLLGALGGALEMCRWRCGAGGRC